MSTGSDSPPRYKPATDNGDDVSLRLLRAEIVHGFRFIDRRLDDIEAEQKSQRLDLNLCKTEIAVLKATALRIDVVRVSAMIGVSVMIVLGLATVITKVAGLW
jgi:hypothetical protein